MPSVSTTKQFSVHQLHRWLGIIAAAIWLLTAVTGVLLTFHFEIEDARFSTAHHPTDLGAIEGRMKQLAGTSPTAQTNWIWTTAGLSDRYIINHTDASGITQMARVLGNGDVLRNDKATNYSFLELTREVHLELVSGRAGQIILGISGILLITNLLFGSYAPWLRKGTSVKTLYPRNTSSTTARLYTWHRVAGPWIAVPLLFVLIAGTLIEFEHDIEHLFGLEPSSNSLPANPGEGPTIGFAKAASTALAALPNSHFVGAVFPSSQDASYEVWLRSSGELFRSYGGSLVVVDANNATVRGVFPASELSVGNKVILYLYTVHTGEIIGVIGRILVLLVGLWLIATLIFNLLLLKEDGKTQNT